MIALPHPSNPLILSSVVTRVLGWPPVWFFVWGGFCALTVGLVVLMWTRWGQTKPFHKCAILSLWAHVLLACLATTVTVVRGIDGGWSRPAPIQVAVHGQTVDDAQDRPTPRETQPWDVAVSVPLVAPTAAALDDGSAAFSLPTSQEALPSTSAESLLREISTALTESQPNDNEATQNSDPDSLLPGVPAASSSADAPGSEQLTADDSRQHGVANDVHTPLAESKGEPTAVATSAATRSGPPWPSSNDKATDHTEDGQRDG